MNIQRDYTEKQHRLRDELLNGAAEYLNVPEYIAFLRRTEPQVTPAAAASRHPSMFAYGPRRLSPYDQRAWR